MKLEHQGIYTDKDRDRISVRKVLVEIATEGLARIISIPVYCYMILPSDIKNKYLEFKEKYKM